MSIEYFVKDDRKAGGRYEHVSGYIRNVDVYGKKIVMEDRTEIPIDDIYDLDIDQNGDVYLHEKRDYGDSTQRSECPCAS